MAIKKLNDRQVQAVRPRLRKNPAHGQDFVSEWALADGGGLYLLVKASGTKSWAFLYSSPSDGKRAKVGLGVYPRVSLSAARAKAAELQEYLARGQDPRDAKSAAKAKQAAARARAETTFGRLASQWHAETAKARKWVEGHSFRQRALLENWALPTLQELPISEISEQQVATLLRKIASTGKSETALRVRGVIRDVFEFARDLGVPDVGDFMRTASNLGRLANPETRHFPAITDPVRLGELLRAMRGYQGRGVAVHAALNLLPLLAQRPGQVIKMKWEQLDLEAGVWAVPASLMKMRSGEKARRPDFLVPLPDQAVSILRALYPYTCNRQFVFAGQAADKHISENTLGAALRALGYDTQRDVTPHGFRTTFLTLSQEHFGSAVAQAADRHLGHMPKIEGSASNLGEAYNRAGLLAERRELVQRWADYLDELADKLPTPVTSSVILARAA